MFPKVSVIMSTYNRDNLLKEAIESVLNQSFNDFEFIIIDDNSTENTCKILNSYNDKRLKIFRNKTNCGCTFNYHNAQNIANGEYIAHIDDDDIWFETKLEKQIEFMQNNQDIVLSGSFIETFGENMRPTWVFYNNPDKIAFMMNFYNPLCHSSIIYKNHFVREKVINYNIKYKCAQDYDFYKQILFAGGKINNIPEVLVKYRMHKKRLTDIKETQDIQIDVAERVKNELLSNFLNDEDVINTTNLMKDFPFNNYDLNNVLKGITLAGEKYTKKYNIQQNIVEEIKIDIENELYKF